MAGISDLLDHLRHGFPEIQAVAYADLDAHLILMTSSKIELHQERWDELCDNGVAMLSGEPAQDAVDAMINGAEIGCALVLQGQELGLFLKSGINPNDAVFCVARPELKIDAFVSEAHDIFAKIADDE